MGLPEGMSSRARGVATAAAIFLPVYVCYCVILSGGAAEMPGDQYTHLLWTLTSPVRVLPHPLYHYTVQWVTWLTAEPGILAARRSAAVVLALAVALRGGLTYRELSSALPPGETAVVCFALAFVMALPNWWNFPAVYLGQVHPNIWHNPTAVFAAPFAVLVFLAALRYWDAPGIGAAAAVGVWSALCALAKPNYLLAFLPCFGPVLLLLLAPLARRRQLAPAAGFGQFLAAFGPPLCVLALQYYWSYGGDSRVVWAPLAAWSLHTSHMPESAALGLAYPLVVAACYPRQLASDRRALFAWCVLAAAVAQYALLAEEPAERFRAGNFGWALVPASYIVFMESCRLVGRHPRDYRWSVCAAVLALHAASGCFYLIRSLVLRGDIYEY
jgi:hypothetical protein